MSDIIRFNSVYWDDGILDYWGVLNLPSITLSYLHHYSNIPSLKHL
jgi:hypothetical protein